VASRLPALAAALGIRAPLHQVQEILQQLVETFATRRALPTLSAASLDAMLLVMLRAVSRCREPDFAMAPERQQAAAAVLDRAAMSADLAECLLGCFTAVASDQAPLR
jgi:hypothetical protein